MKLKLATLLFCFLSVISCKQKEDITLPLINTFIESITINGNSTYNNGSIYNVPVDSVVIRVTFSSTIDKKKIDPSKMYISNNIDTSFIVATDTSSKQLTFRIRKPLNYYTTYTLFLVNGENLGVKLLDSNRYFFVTQLDPAPKFPLISDDSLLTLVQKKTFDYFWNYAHPVSGLARERFDSGDIVTFGGSGSGITSIPAAIERGFITRAQGLQRMNKILNFLNLSTTDKFHGAFPHWMNGTTGKVIPFGQRLEPRATSDFDLRQERRRDPVFVEGKLRFRDCQFVETDELWRIEALPVAQIAGQDECLLLLRRRDRGGIEDEGIAAMPADHVAKALLKIGRTLHSEQDPEQRSSEE